MQASLTPFDFAQGRRAVLIHLACTLNTNAPEGRVNMAASGKHILIADDDLDAIGISGFEAPRRRRRNPFTHDIPLIPTMSCAVRLRTINGSRAGVSIRAAVRQPSHLAVQRAQDNG